MLPWSGRVIRALHVDARHDRWVGHDSGAGDAHYHWAQPWACGRFTGGFGLQHVFVPGGGNRECFWFNNFYWDVAPYDYNIVSDWNWVADQIVIYDDPNRRKRLPHIYRRKCRNSADRPGRLSHMTPISATGA
jgi:hypothetical protein